MSRSITCRPGLGAPAVASVVTVGMPAAMQVEHGGRHLATVPHSQLEPDPSRGEAPAVLVVLQAAGDRHTVGDAQLESLPPRPLEPTRRPPDRRT